MMDFLSKTGKSNGFLPFFLVWFDSLRKIEWGVGLWDASWSEGVQRRITKGLLREPSASLLKKRWENLNHRRNGKTQANRTKT